MPEPILIALGLVAAALAVLVPLRRTATADPHLEEHDAATVRHRVTLETLRDVEADHAAGSLDAAAYASQLAEAQARAAETRVALERTFSPQEHATIRRAPTLALLAAGVIGAVLLGGSFVDASGIPNATVVNQPLADAQAAETARQDRIQDLLATLSEDPRDADTLSDLADAYLAGSTGDDLVRAAVSLQVLIDLEPDRSDAYERLMTAYLRAGDYANARSVHDSYAELDSADPVELAFFDGLIALRGENDPDRAAAAIDRFLQLAPEDPRATMIRGLRDEAASSG
jgi:tetratricopeptide (TPR) repeat protein